MQLGQILPDVDGASAAVEVTSLAFDDREVQNGALFFCVTGFNRDGHEFAEGAVARGAAALVVERRLDLPVPQVVVPSARKAMGPAAANFFGHPSKDLRVIGVTGTNGKTTTAYLVRHILEAGGLGTGLVGTVETIVAGERVEAIRTTPEAIGLQQLFRRMVDEGDKAVAIEVSSHALDLGRVDGTEFAASIFTNLTQDHLDWHGSMEAYWNSKKRLFTDLPCGQAILNIDDSHGRELAAELQGAVTVGLSSDAGWAASNVSTGLAGSEFDLSSPLGSQAVSIRLPGEFNVVNALGAAAAAAAVGLGLDEIVAGLQTAGGVPGRFEPVDAGQPFAVLVDYAHTPDSLENVLRAAKEVATGRVICVVGCGGDRDSVKRPLMGGIASDLAEIAILTSDNPRSEDPEEILAQMVSGTDGSARVIVDRREAIEVAVNSASEGDVVLIAGKGHEQGQEFADGMKLPFDDRQVVRESLAAAGWTT